MHTSTTYLLIRTYVSVIILVVNQVLELELTSIVYILPKHVNKLPAYRGLNLMLVMHVLQKPKSPKIKVPIASNGYTRTMVFISKSSSIS